MVAVVIVALDEVVLFVLLIVLEIVVGVELSVVLLLPFGVVDPGVLDDSVLVV